MDLMERPSMRRLVRDLKRHAPLLSLGVMAIVVLVSTAVVIGASRQAPDRDAGLTALASPSSRPSATPPMTPAPTPSITPVPATPTPAATPEAPPPTPVASTELTDEGAEVDTDPVDEDEDYYDEEPINVEDPEYVLEPDVNLLIGGMEGDAGFYIRTGETVEAVLQFPTRDLDQSACSLTQSYEPDDPAGTPWTVSLEPLPVQSISMADGRHTFVAECPSTAGDLTARVRANAMDRKPEACRDFEFVRDEISVSSFEELAAGVVGTWKGCVTTPWTPMYEVTVTLREDGTYSAASTEVLDGNDMVAMYYGTDDDFPAKLYAINDFQDSQLGIGQIDVVFGPEPGVRDELRNVRLMGDKLEFELFHMDDYGPLTFQLYQQ
jgi:hypothetical protein